MHLSSTVACRSRLLRWVKLLADGSRSNAERSIVPLAAHQRATPSPPPTTSPRHFLNMPNILSNIPGLSALPSIPNPINLFTDDARPLSSILRPNNTPNGTPKAAAEEDSETPGRNPNRLAPPDPSTPTPGSPTSKRLNIADPRSSSVTVATDAGGESDTGGPRTAIQPEGRRRGLSVGSRASAMTGVAGADRRRRRVETFVLVKPPPTSGKNPLNLQVQLVVPARNPNGRPRKGSSTDSTRIPSGSSIATSGTAASVAVTGETSSAASTPARGSLEESAPSTPESDTETATGPKTPSGGSGLKRSGSLSSTKSNTSGASSTASGPASGKRIIPLYNLAVHNVMQPTLVTDAGTDSKVAKYMKRYLDISGVGVLEPTEVWLMPVGAGVSGSSPRPSFNLSHRPNRPASMMSNMSNLTPASSRVDVDSQRASTETKSSAREAPREDGAKKFFGKIFRKRNSAEPIGDRLSKIASASTTFLTPDSPAVKSPTTPASPLLAPSTAEVVPVGQSSSATFGLSPSVLSRNMAEISLDESGAIIGLTKDELLPDQDTIALSRSRRPIGYSWTVRKWAKRNTEGWAAHLVAAAAAGLELVAGALPADGEDEVIFEWVKMRVSPIDASGAAALRRHPAADALDPSRLRRPRRTTTLGLPSPAGSRHGSRTSLVDQRDALPSPLKGTSSRRSSTLPPPDTRPSGQNSASASDAESELGPRLRDSRPTTPLVHVEDDDDEYDSDPEDSETPWTCSVYVKHTGQRQLLATLTPAPHHPKVIGVLKIPQGLRSISLANVGTLATASAQRGQNGQELAQRVGEEVCLTEENLKDVVSVTAMWLVAREEFGGLGRQKKSKK